MMFSKLIYAFALFSFFLFLFLLEEIELEILDVFPQNSIFFLQILMIILKIDVTLNKFIDMQFFNYCLNQIFP